MRHGGRPVPSIEQAPIPWMGDGACVRFTKPAGHARPAERDLAPRDSLEYYRERLLTDRQAQLVRLLAQGKKQRELTSRFRVRPAAMRRDLQGICDRLNLYSVRQVAQWARLYPEFLL